MVQEESKNKALDVNVFRGSGRRFSDHQLVAAKIRCLRGVALEGDKNEEEL